MYSDLNYKQVNRKVLAAYLRNREFDFEEVENGEEGVKLFKQHPAGYFE
jgi:CheY-like chemotaxis protein